MTDFLPILATYLKKIEVIRANPQATDELSLRDALSGVLEATRKELGKRVEFVGEGKKIKSGQRPDYTVTRSGLPIGYIEAEKVEAELADLKGHSKTQNDKFIADLDNFLLSNHFDFRLYSGGSSKSAASVRLPERAADLEAAHGAAWESLFSQFLQADFAPVKDPAQLAQILARRAGLLATEIFGDLGDKGSYSSSAFDQFKRELLPNLDQKEFAALYAQTLAYGLFAARTLSGEDGFSVESAAKRLKAIPLLASLFRNFEAHLDDRLGWILKEIVAVLKRAPMDAITGYFQKRVGRLDPMIDFYEPFLQAYDSKTREVRGVYYTPESVVGYIVRSVDALLKRDFALETGLCEPKVQVLDPATGTGSFLFAVVDKIHDELEKTGSWKTEAESVLARLFGLELMVAPYTIAHLKLWLQLDAYGTPPAKRLGIYLSNTLDNPRPPTQGDFDLGQEFSGANEVKAQHPILVVMGNPPYSGHSANSNFIEGNRGQLTAVGQRLESYKLVDGAKLGEKNPKWLQDDYVKFIAFAQNRIEQSGEGVVAFITNHGYLDNPTFRGLRASLMDSFDALYVLDLHGNAKKKEVAPDGSKDENVFAIQQGVAILLAVKTGARLSPNSSSACAEEEEATASLGIPRSESLARTSERARVFHASLWGRQGEKYAALETSDVLSTTWQPLTPKAPSYFFVPRDEELLPEYEKGWSVDDIFPISSPAIVTGQDAKTIAHSQEQAENLAVSHLLTASTVRKILCGPFDWRHIVYDSKVVTRSRSAVARHMLAGKNISLVTVNRVPPSEEPRYVLVSETLISNGAIRSDSVSIDRFFPLYLYEKPKAATKTQSGTLEGLDLESVGLEKRVNISEKYLARIQNVIGEEPTPEAIFHFIYASLHSPAYRACYGAFLKTDFPRVPLPQGGAQFAALAALGQKLVALHTLDSAGAPELLETRFALTGDGANLVSKVEYDADAKRLKFNATRGFEGVPRAVWEWKIGGYQVAKKWLDDRKTRVLGHKDILHFQKTLIALDETRALMLAIDAVGVIG